MSFLNGVSKWLATDNNGKQNGGKELNVERLFDLEEMAQKKGAGRQNGWTGMDILSVSQFDKEKLEFIFGRAREMRAMVERVGGADLLSGRVLTCLFYEPSTRTSASFIAAMERLGGSVIPITQGVQFSSVSKGETLPDTIRTLEQYSDVIVLRLSLIHISEPTRPVGISRMPSSA